MKIYTKKNCQCRWKISNWNFNPRAPSSVKIVILKKRRQCDKTYKSKVSLRKHVKDAHSVKCLQCDECEKMFSAFDLLNDHKRKVHNLKLHKCDQCEFRSIIKGDLKRHMGKLKIVCRFFDRNLDDLKKIFLIFD